ALLGVNASRASWHTAMLPAQFPIFNLTSGIALMLVFLGFFGIVQNADQRTRLLRVLSLLIVALLIVKAYFLWVDYSQALYSGIPQAVEAVNLVLFGPFGWAFWVLQIGVGMVIPIIVLIQPNLTKRGVLVGFIGVFVLIGLAVARTSIIFPALAIPELEGLATAFTGPHLSFNYVPSIMEWSVTVGVVGLSTLAYLIGSDLLPFLKNKTEVA
ncbi:MAG: polysulfide reductase NrfD, partial [Anaerolinea sp.]|nr:polysulfide reductase NrfD [Anaerolinea sp.]